MDSVQNVSGTPHAGNPIVNAENGAFRWSCSPVLLILTGVTVGS